MKYRINIATDSHQISEVYIGDMQEAFKYGAEKVKQAGLTGSVSLNITKDEPISRAWYLLLLIPISLIVWVTWIFGFFGGRADIGAREGYIWAHVWHNGFIVSTHFLPLSEDSARIKVMYLAEKDLKQIRGN